MQGIWCQGEIVRKKVYFLSSYNMWKWYTCRIEKFLLLLRVPTVRSKSDLLPMISQAKKYSVVKVLSFGKIIYMSLFCKRLKTRTCLWLHHSFVLDNIKTHVCTPLAHYHSSFISTTITKHSCQLYPIFSKYIATVRRNCMAVHTPLDQPDDCSGVVNSLH